MSHQPQEQLTPKQQALHDLEEARGSLAYHASHAAEDWSPKAIITRSVHKHRAWWIGGAAVAGLALIKAVLPSRGYSRHHESSLSGTQRGGLFALLLSPLIGLARKYLMSYGTQLVQSYLQQKISPNASDSEAV